MSFHLKAPQPTSTDIHEGEGEMREELKKLRKLYESARLLEESRELMRQSEALRECATEGHTGAIQVPFLFFFRRRICGRCRKKI